MIYSFKNGNKNKNISSIHKQKSTSSVDNFGKVAHKQKKGIFKNTGKINTIAFFSHPILVQLVMPHFVSNITHP